jgi:hypothetical protein
MLGTIAVMPSLTDQSKTTRPLRFVVWFSIAATTAIVAWLALTRMPRFQSGPGGLSALGAIPNVVILVACGIFAILCWFTRPPKSEWRRPIVIPTAAGFCVVAGLLWFDSSLWGGCRLRVRIVDKGGNPIPGITVDFLKQKGFGNLTGFFRNAFIANDVDVTSTSDGTGEVSLLMNRYQAVGALVNQRFGPRGHGIENAAYLWADFRLDPRLDGDMRGSVSWSVGGRFPNMNPKSKTLGKFDPVDETLIVYLPRAGGG